MAPVVVAVVVGSAAPSVAVALVAAVGWGKPPTPPTLHPPARAPHHALCSYVNSITNELFMSASTALWEAGSTQVFSNFTALGWAQAEWTWFHSGPLQQANGLLIDGLKNDCKGTTGAYWT